VLARSKGFEPLTPRFEVWCSIQLSYERARAHNSCFGAKVTTPVAIAAPPYGR
jgi:hypothetical protein